ncbi:Rv2175c family DNA-binding protein [Nocardioides sp. BP30]|uniref:Rv2175c family DNA-binding protein n=1 Tax=Nocardioides sp. BP30 TaxID=3036374 RepID=UPI002468472B|nr:Rv2175c family DNA-binding protein [Nocardioides sp. BP30]WGL53842.1 Rv2175c family DNA-binding protein [Nocardioides sp. BP30]
MSEHNPEHAAAPAADQPRLADHNLAELVTDWLDWAQAGKLLGVTPAKVRTLVREHQLAAAVPNPGEKGAGQRVPALFVQDGFPVKGLAGLLTVLHDGGYDDRECIAWLFLDQDLPGRPIDALRENRGSEVKRRAQAMAF